MACQEMSEASDLDGEEEVDREIEVLGAYFCCTLVDVGSCTGDAKARRCAHE